MNGSSYLGTLGIYAFQDNGALERNERGLFVGQGAAISGNYKIHHKMVERSNSNMVQGVRTRAPSGPCRARPS